MGAVSSLGGYFEADRVPRVSLTAVWQQARYLLPDHPMLKESSLRMRETFALLEVSRDRLDASGRLPIFEGKWLHLLGDGDLRPVYLLSRPIGPTSRDWQLLGSIQSDVGHKIFASLRWAKRNLKGRYQVRVLRIPECRLVALLLHATDKDLVIVADAPTDRALFKVNRHYRYSEFAKQAQRLPRVKGLEVSAAEAQPPTPAKTRPGFG